MIRIAGADDLKKIVVINPKGGCGKTTLATNLAGAYALRESPPTLIDCDPQGFCIRWLEQRPAERPVCYGIDANTIDDAQPIELPSDSKVVIIDLPAGTPVEDFHSWTHLADRVLLPVVPSAIDVFSASRFIAELMLDAQLDRSQQKLAIVANRVNSRTKSFEMLKRFLASLQIPLVATLRDSQVFVQAAASGLGICELPSYLVKNDLPQMNAIIRWLDKPRTRVARDTQLGSLGSRLRDEAERDRETQREGVQT